MNDFWKSAASQMVGFVVFGLIAFGIFFFGTNIETGSFSINPSRNVVKISENALLVKQDISERSTVLVARNDGQSLYSVCSEPPPDGAQEIAKQLGASLNAEGSVDEEQTGKLSAEAISNLKTATQSLFDRSQGIQLLRDTMFRICEAFQNGVIDERDYSKLMTQLISTANFIIPFEQCAEIAIEVERQFRLSSAATQESPSVYIFRSCSESALEFNKSQLQLRYEVDRSQEKVLQPMETKVIEPTVQ